MRGIMRHAVLFSALMALLAGIAGAEPVVVFSGDLSLKPTVFHKDPITGQLTLLVPSGASDAQLAQAKAKLDKPLMGKTDYASSEQGWYPLDLGSGESQLTTAFKLAGVSHKWFFVHVGRSKDGLTFAGPVYRVQAVLDDIGKLAAADLAAPPKDWKPIGEATLKK
jgi:hypothetical protein